MEQLVFEVERARRRSAANATILLHPFSPHRRADVVDDDNDNVFLVLRVVGASPPPLGPGVTVEPTQRHHRRHPPIGVATV